MLALAAALAGRGGPARRPHGGPATACPPRAPGSPPVPLASPGGRRLARAAARWLELALAVACVGLDRRASPPRLLFLRAACAHPTTAATMRGGHGRGARRCHQDVWPRARARRCHVPVRARRRDGRSRSERVG